jgi:hypothetical protein
MFFKVMKPLLVPLVISTGISLLLHKVIYIQTHRISKKNMIRFAEDYGILPILMLCFCLLKHKLFGKITTPSWEEKAVKFIRNCSAL